MRVLVVNGGSSSLKLRLLSPDDQVLATADVEPWDGDPEVADVKAFVAGLPGVDAVGHRVVHGGDEGGAVLVDDDVEARLAALAPLAPLHQERSLAGIQALRTALPGAPAVACFDTAFHATLPPAAATYALPEHWRARWGLRRYGFHGLSHAYAVRRAADLLGARSRGLRVVSCHLGAGASLCAALGGRSVDTTMGFTPLEGLVMATRSGSVDPGLVLWLVERAGMAVAEVSRGLEHEAGLAGLWGPSGDMRGVVDAANDGDERAGLALDVYLHRLRREIAAMAAALGGLDALVFTGGVGEHQPAVRARAVEGLAFLGLALDQRRNSATTGDGDVSEAGCAARTVVVTAREDLEITRQVRALLGRGASPA